MTTSSEDDNEHLDDVTHGHQQTHNEADDQRDDDHKIVEVPQPAMANELKDIDDE